MVLVEGWVRDSEVSQDAGMLSLSYGDVDAVMMEEAIEIARR